MAANRSMLTRAAKQSISPMRALLAAWLLLACQLSWSAERYSATLLVPETKGLAKKIYQDIVDGIASNDQLDISIVAINKETQVESVEKILAEQPSDIVIAVGNTSYKLCNQLDVEAHKVAGGISGAPNGIPTVSLTASPEQTFTELKQIAPHIKQVRMVYNQAMNGWWYQRAIEVAAEFDLEVVGYEASDIKQAVKQYQTMLSDAQREITAIWVPLRGIVPSKTILPLLLETAWNKKLAVVSNNPSHTKLGSLLALYPNHVGMGKQMGEFAITHITNEKAPLIQGTQYIRSAINLRTSSHIGLRIDKKDNDRFDRIYPVQR